MYISLIFKNMKTKILSLVSMFLIGTMTLFAQSKTEKFKAYGKCSMCEKRIETAAKSVAGVKSADWNIETNMIEVSFDTTKTDVNKIQMAIANVGHDTDKYRATDETYNKLPQCCHYERPVAKPQASGHEGHMSQ